MIRIAINGYGRIGRCVTRAFYEGGYGSRAEIAAINDIADFDSRIRLTNHDSTRGRFKLTAGLHDGCMVIGDDRIKLLKEPDSALLPWGGMGIDAVLDCTGLLQQRTEIIKHLDSGAEKILLSYPGPADVDMTVVYGINHNLLLPAHRIVSNASCTSNCAVPVLSVLDTAFGIEHGSLTVIHSVMNDQPAEDEYHHIDPRRNRSGMHSIVPVETRLSAGIARILPGMNGRISSTAVRVPASNVSAIDFSLALKKDTNPGLVNDALSEASNTYLRGIMGIENEPLVSADYLNDSRSCIMDHSLTRVENGRLLRIFAWFDNEWAFSMRMLDTVLAMFA